MKAYHGLGRHDEVRTLWDGLSALGLEPSAVTVAIFTRSLAAQGMVYDVRASLRENQLFLPELTSF